MNNRRLLAAALSLGLTLALAGAGVALGGGELSEAPSYQSNGRMAQAQRQRTNTTTAESTAENEYARPTLKGTYTATYSNTNSVAVPPMVVATNDVTARGFATQAPGTCVPASVVPRTMAPLPVTYTPARLVTSGVVPIPDVLAPESVAPLPPSYFTASYGTTSNANDIGVYSIPGPVSGYGSPTYTGVGTYRAGLHPVSSVTPYTMNDYGLARGGPVYGRYYTGAYTTRSIPRVYTYGLR